MAICPVTSPWTTNFIKANISFNLLCIEKKNMSNKHKGILGNVQNINVWVYKSTLEIVRQLTKCDFIYNDNKEAYIGKIGNIKCFYFLRTILYSTTGLSFRAKWHIWVVAMYA